MFKLAISNLRAFTPLHLRLSHFFALPKHEVLSMPALSPTMKEGKILKWLVKEGDKVEPGDAIAEIQTDKATMSFEVQEKGYIAKINTSTQSIPIGDPVVVVIKKADQVGQFSSFKFEGSQGASESKQAQKTEQKSKSDQKSKAVQKPKSASSSAPMKEYPKHSFLQMPAVSPTMTEGKILQWKIKPGDAFTVGDALFSIQTDKAVVDYEATEKGVLAKVIAKENQALPIGTDVAVVVKNKENVDKFKDFEASTPTEQKEGANPFSSETQSQSQSQSSSSSTKASSSNVSSGQRSDGRVISSPLARVFAKKNDIDLSQIKGSGPNGRIIKQDVDAYAQGDRKQPTKTQQTTTTQTVSEQPSSGQAKQKPSKISMPQNPYQQLPLSGMRKTIAARLTQSKQTIPHYYVSISIEMDAVTSLRSQLNGRQKQNGVKISVNDIILKAMALALRDYPDVNVQWHGNHIKRFKHSDISVAVAVGGGLITPIVSRAQTLGLLDLARRTKDIAKRAREGKLDPSEYTGGTSTISNLGMFGINTVTSIINPPQASILGVGKTQTRLLPATGGPQPYRLAQVMDVIASCDHRAVDGALTAQWLNRIKHYLQNPIHMLL